MTDYYMDKGSGASGNTGLSWAQAMDTLENLLAKMSAGDRGWVRQGTTDTSASNRTFTSNGAVNNPCIVTGVASGTTNEPPVESDLATTLPIIATSAVATMTFSNKNYTQWNNIEFDNALHFYINDANDFYDCDIDLRGRFITYYRNIFDGGTIDIKGASGQLYPSFCVSEYKNVTFVFTTQPTALFRVYSNCTVTLFGCDISGLTNPLADMGGNEYIDVLLRQCKIPAALNIFDVNPTTKARVRAVGCSNSTAAKGNNSSFQDFAYEDAHGTIDDETTVVRTGGADDGASGQFSWAMTPFADATLENSNAKLSSPEMAIWVPGGTSQILTVYITNDGSGDYNEDEIACEFYTPDASDTAQHTQTWVPDKDAQKFPSSTAVAVDTGSTWVTHNTHKQKFSVTIDIGYEGWVFARVHVSKRQASPDTVYVDPRIEKT